MYEKILQKLKKQREKNSNVSDRSLEDLARSLSGFITTDEVLEKADLSAAIKSIDGNISHYTKTQLEQSEKERKEKEEKEEEERKAEEARKKAAEEGKPDIAGEVAKALQTALAPLAQQISSLKAEKTSESRKEKLETSLKDMPEYFKKPIMDSFNTAKFENDNQFNDYLSGVNTSKDSFTQQLKEAGLPTSTPSSDVHVEEETGASPVLSDAMKIVEKSKESKQE